MSVLSRRVPRPSIALVVAFAALFIALGGTGYAALKITGKSIVNSSLTGLDVKNRSLGPQEIKPDTLGGDQINEAALATVPSAQHAATADSAANATKAADADAIGGIPAAQLMTVKTRAYESGIAAQDNIDNNEVIGTLADVPPGEYVVTARLSYYNPGATETESCSLHVPGTNDTTQFVVGGSTSETITLQESMTSAAVFSPSVTCSSDANDDVIGTGSIIAVRVD